VFVGLGSSGIVDAEVGGGGGISIAGEPAADWRAEVACSEGPDDWTEIVEMIDIGEPAGRRVA
jgi:hypothetical protein